MSYSVKSLSLALCFVALFQCVNAQDNRQSDTAKEHKHPMRISHQIGINVAPFMDRFLKFNNTTNNTVVPYIFSYRLQFLQRSVIRLAVGASVANEDVTSSTSSDPRKNKSNATNVGFGYEYYLLRNTKWKAGAGLHFFIAKADSESHQIDNPSSTEFIQKEKTTEWGLGPTLSVQYFIGRRVSLGTEGGIYYSQRENTLDTEVIGQFPQTSNSKSKQTLLTAHYPISLFINFNF